MDFLLQILDFELQNSLYSSKGRVTGSENLKSCELLLHLQHPVLASPWCDLLLRYKANYFTVCVELFLILQLLDLHGDISGLPVRSWKLLQKDIKLFIKLKLGRKHSYDHAALDRVCIFHNKFPVLVGG